MFFDLSMDSGMWLHVLSSHFLREPWSGHRDLSVNGLHCCQIVKNMVNIKGEHYRSPQLWTCLVWKFS